MGIRDLKAIDWREFWERFNCPECDAWNWWYSGHSQREIGPADFELVIRCWSCKKLFLLRSFDECVDNPDDDQDPVDGIRDPTDIR